MYGHYLLQLPYALLVAAVSFVSYLAAPFVGNVWISLPLAVLLMFATLFFLRLVLRGAVSEESIPVVFRKFAQSVNDAALSSTMGRMGKSMLADGQIDRTESAQLLDFLKGIEGQEKFRQALMQARTDGVITMEEFASLEGYIKRLAQGRD